MTAFPTHRPFSLLLVVSLFSSTFAWGDWVELYDGQSLAGWMPNVDEEAYTITEDGALRLQASDSNIRSHLFYVGDDEEPDLFINFELEATVRAEGDANSGIFFHTDGELRDNRAHLANGYEVQLNSKAKKKRTTGSLYDVVDLSEAVVNEQDWFTVRIRVEGKRIQVWINDTRTVDYTEPENVAAERSKDRKGRVLREEGGAIALQAHDADSIFFFQSLRIKPLS